MKFTQNLHSYLMMDVNNRSMSVICFERGFSEDPTKFRLKNDWLKSTINRVDCAQNNYDLQMSHTYIFTFSEVNNSSFSLSTLGGKAYNLV